MGRILNSDTGFRGKKDSGVARVALVLSPLHTHPHEQTAQADPAAEERADKEARAKLHVQAHGLSVPGKARRPEQGPEEEEWGMKIVRSEVAPDE